MNRKRSNRKGRRVQPSKWRRYVLLLALIVALGTAGALILPAMTMEQVPVCGLEEHTHTDECYTEKKTLICPLEEGEVHYHTDECYEEVQVLVCTKEEGPDHTHGPECYETQRVLVCPLEEGVPHVHTEDCYRTERVLTCGKPEHVHTKDCFLRPDPKADVESADLWESTMPLNELSGQWAEDLLAIAQSQVGYTESSQNFRLDGAQNVMGYSRYGAWAGDAYQPWNEAFAAFCLHYAQIPEAVIPSAADSRQWMLELTESGHFTAMTDAMPSPGDLLFLDKNGDGHANRVAIVEKTDERIHTIEGDAGGQVARRDYALEDSLLLGFCPVAQIQAQQTEAAAAQSYTLTARSDEMHLRVTLTGLCQPLPEGAQLQAEAMSAADSSELYPKAIAGAQQLLEKDQQLGGFSLFTMSITDGDLPIAVPKTAKVHVEADFAQPLFTSDEVAQAAQVETIVLDSQHSGKPASVDSQYGGTANGVTHVSFESQGLPPFAVLLANETQTGQFWKVCRKFDSTDFKNGASYVIVSVDGSYALTNNRSGGKNATHIELQPVKGNPDYYTISHLPSNALWTYENNRNTGKNFYQGSSRSPSAVVDPSISSLFNTQKIGLGISASSAPACFQLYGSDYYGYQYFLNYYEDNNNNYFLTNAGEYLYSSSDSARQYDRTSDLQILQQVSTTLTIPQDAVAQDGGSGQQGTAHKPDYPGYVSPTGEKTGSYESDTATVDYASDPSTSQLEHQFGRHPLQGRTDFEAQRGDNGKAMMDKSVIYGQDDYGAFQDYGDGVFSVTLSALGQAFVVDESVTKVPLDVMLVLDMSNSMNETDRGQKQSRAKILVQSVNKTIDNLMKANPENRVGAVGFNSGAFDLMDLDHYNRRDGKYFDFTVGANDEFGNPRISIRALRRGGSAGAVHPCEGGTYTQLGIAQGYDLLLRDTPRPEDTTYTTTVNGQTVSRPRKPVIILVSDGEPTHCTDHYMDVLHSPYYGDGRAPLPNGRGVMGYYTILSANYYKRMAGIHYDNPSTMYTVAFGMKEQDTTILEGSIGTEHYRATVMNPTSENIDYLHDITTSYSNAVEGPLYDMLQGKYGYYSQWVGSRLDLISSLGKPHALVPVLSTNPYQGDYAYADKAYLGNSGNEGLDAAFEDIIKLNTVYDFSYETQADRPLTLSDPIGEGMEIKGDPVLRINGQNYAPADKKTQGSTTIYHYAGVVPMDPYSGRTVDLSTIRVQVETKDGVQKASLEIPPKSLPTYTADPTLSYYQEALPLRLIYQVGLSAEGQAQIDQLETGEQKSFCTNRYTDGQHAQGTLSPSSKNPYYKKSGWKVTVRKDSNPTATDKNALVKGGTAAAVDYQLGNNGRLTITKKAPVIVPADPISVEKRWQDWTGQSTAEDLPPSITATLYRTYPDEHGQVIREDVSEFTLNAENGWKHTFTAEELKAAAGRSYRYYVSEVPLDGYQVTYTGDGVDSNTPEHPIVITNRCRYSDTVLPNTGGHGTWPLTAAGLALMAGALIAHRSTLRARRQKKEK